MQTQNSNSMSMAPGLWPTRDRGGGRHVDVKQLRKSFGSGRRGRMSDRG